jgi:phosphatidylserine decarboxylase
MEWGVNLYGMILGLIILLPLAWKWQIDKRVSFLAAISIGFVSGFAVKGMEIFWPHGAFTKLSLQIVVILSLAGALVLWRFFRDPERTPPENPNLVLSPADGKVIYIKEIEKGEIPYSEKKGRKFSLNDFTRSNTLPSEGYLVGIAMNFLDVHVNRAPISGKISVVQHILGGFASLKIKEAVIQNERALTIIDSGRLAIGVVQIASRLVRKIVLYHREGYEIHRGERMGMIRFGSQVDLILPKLPSLRVEVSPGENLKAGVSPVARIVVEQDNV